MKRTTCIATVGFLFANGALPALAQNCSASATGAAYTLTAVPKAKSSFSLDDGYFLNVSIHGKPAANGAPAEVGPAVHVMLDSGSNVLVVPAYVVPGFPQNPDQDTTGLVISNQLPYSFGSSGNGYLGYMVRTPVDVKDNSGQVITTAPVELFAAQEFCTFAKQPDGTTKHIDCRAVVPPGPGEVGGPGMMGIGFQTPPATLQIKTATGFGLPTLTNVFQQMPGIQTQGWIFQGDQIVAGLNQQVTQKFGDTWTAMVPTMQDGTSVLSAEGCFQVTPAGSTTATARQCGKMLLDTGMSAMNVWVKASDYASVCPAAPAAGTSPGVGFDGTPFPPNTAVAITSPLQTSASANPTMDYGFSVPDPNGKTQPSAGTPTGTMCSKTTGAQSFFNTGRMPLALYSFARNQTCGTYAYVKN